jgi:hypothetical protein
VQDSITITFPAGTVVGAPTASIVIGPGWVDNGSGLAWDALPDVMAGAWTFDAAGRWIKYTLANTGIYVGASADVRIEVTAGITNPDTPGDYNLTVVTSQETTAVTSQTYAIGTPIIDPLSGIVSGYNAAGILMAQSHSIQDCINAAGPNGKVEVGPGTYTLPVNANVAGQTIIGTGDASTVIVKPTTEMTINGAKVTLDGLTISNTGAGDVIGIYTEATIKNCSITPGATNAIVIDANNTTSIINTAIDTTRTGGQIAIEGDGAKVTVTDCTLKVGTGDTGIDADTGAAISGTTITGSSGKGVLAAGGAVTIDKSTFTSLSPAIDVTGGSVTMSNSVVDGCGSATVDAIDISPATVVRMYNNTVQNSNAAMRAFDAGNGADVEVHFNNILNNTKNVNAVTTANFSHNWWGAATGPAAGSNTGPVVTTPVLGSSVTAAGLAIDAAALVAKTAVGIDVAILTGTGTPGMSEVIGVAKYSANPELTPPTIMGTGSVLGYYDVYAAGVGAGQIVQVKFYVSVSPYTKIYYAGGISGRWVDANAGVNTASGFAYLNIGGVDSGLTVSDLGGTVFAVVEDKTTTTGPSIATGVGAPLIGAYDVSIEPMFTWGTVAGAIRYEIALSEDPTFTIIEWSYNVDQNFYKVDEPLRYDTTYYWRVRGVLGEPYQQNRVWVTPSSPWTVGIFTTESEPEPPAEPIVVNPVKPEVNVEIPPTKITIEPSDPAIPTYMLWIIVAVGAILVIALIVLIVRTRRVV